MKKRKYISLFLVLMLGFIGLTFRFQAHEVSRQEFLKTLYDMEDLRQYYHDSIPGLARAEELDLVKPIHKTLPIHDTDGILKLDRIWYGELGGYILYHVDNADKAIDLGGAIFERNFEEEDLSENIEFIEDSPDNGVIYNGGYYSFVRIPAIDHSKIKEKISYRPVVSIDGLSYTLDDIPLDLNSLRTEEPVKKIKLGTSIDTGRGKLNLIRLESRVSYNRIYLSYEDPSYLSLHSIDGLIHVDKGTGFTIQENMILGDEEDNIYYMDTRPFEDIPDTFKMDIHRLTLIDDETIRIKLDTTPFSGKRGLHSVNKNLQRFYDTDLILNNIEIGEEKVAIRINFVKTKAEAENLYLAPTSIFTKDHNKLLHRINSRNIIIPNTISVWNDMGREPSKIDAVLESPWRENTIELIIPLDFWEISNRIIISIENPTVAVDIDN